MDNQTYLFCVLNIRLITDTTSKIKGNLYKTFFMPFISVSYHQSNEKSLLE